MRILGLFAALITVGLYAPAAQACGCQAKKAQGACDGNAGGGCGCAVPGQCGSGCGGMGEARRRIDRSTYRLASNVAWRTLEQGRAEARAKRLPMLVHFSFGSQCQHCAALEKRVFGDRTLAATLNGASRAIPVRVPLWAMRPGERAFAEQVGYGEECLLALTAADGTVLRTSGANSRELSTRGIPAAAALLETLEPLVN